MAGWLRRWWQHSDRFDWFSLYLDDLRVRTMVRVGVAGVIAVFSAVVIAMVWSPAGSHGALKQVGGAVAGISGAAMAGFWVLRWPTRRQSRLFVFFADAAIAIACLSQSDPVVGLIGCYAFVVLGAYIALMHCAKATIYNFAVSVVIASILTSQVLSRRGDMVLAICESVVLTLFSIGAPVALQTMLQVMARDIVRSDCDALTGLLNRRGFYRHTSRLLDRCGDAEVGYFTITMIDLDHFKRINDLHGHLTGDQALVEVAGALRSHSGASALIARAGGEEFLIADVHLDKWSPAAALLCRAIADTPQGVTASIGTASIPVAQMSQHNKRQLIDDLIARADAAMYIAKKAGGNQHQPCGAAPSLNTTKRADNGSSMPEVVGL